MALTLSKAGISTGANIEAYHVTQSIDAFTKVAAYDLVASGSLTLTGSLAVTQTVSAATGSMPYVYSTNVYLNYLSGSTVYASTGQFETVRANSNRPFYTTYVLPPAGSAGAGSGAQIYFIDASAGGGSDFQLDNLPDSSMICIRDVGNPTSGNQVLITTNLGLIITNSGTPGTSYTLPVTGSITLVKSGSNYYQLS